MNRKQLDGKKAAQRQQPCGRPDLLRLRRIKTNLTHTKRAPPIYRYEGKNEPKQELKINKYEGGFRNIQTYNADVRVIVLIQDAQIGQNTIQNCFRSKNVIYRRKSKQK